MMINDSIISYGKKVYLIMNVFILLLYNDVLVVSNDNNKAFSDKHIKCTIFFH